MEIVPLFWRRRKGSTIIQTERSLCHVTHYQALRRLGDRKFSNSSRRKSRPPGRARLPCIKVKAIGINRAESMWRTDMYIEPLKFPAGLGYEAVGLVDSIGKDVSGIAVGDEVNVLPSFSMNQYHTYGEAILVPDYAVVKHLGNRFRSSRPPRCG